MKYLESWELRAEFARRLSVMYGAEVPAYNTLVGVSTEVNRDFFERHGASAERFGSISRVTAERHGAIRVGSPREMAQVARVFAAFGMYPVGFYDLRDASSSAVPVVSTAFRPVDPEELARNPFRVFTSMLAAEDPRFFTPTLQEELAAFIGARKLFGEELLTLADRAAAEKSLGEADAERLLTLATAVFELSDEPVDLEWYRRLEAVSAVAADIGGVTTTHINHLTPRVLDIDGLYERMQSRGITMIDEIQGPPRWPGPDVLLRQTSFRALGENRVFRHSDGTVHDGELRVRFGEVEARGIALTAAGRVLYDDMVAETDRLLADHPHETRVDLARTVWERHLPHTEQDLAEQGLAFFTFTINEEALSADPVVCAVTLQSLIAAGIVTPEPIVYEDFLPRSAAGIFQSNLTEKGSKDEGQTGTDYDIDRMSLIVGATVLDPTDLYQRQQDASVTALAQRLGVDVTY
ncbi:VOC family protein [Cryobacterium psychrophilum]|uniref:2-oxoadipate dioxygenase/decarboxylase n=1 Tax=Cryobacterium psychrophilum TaxID=41988 RepID=A0A4Y8KRW0_9MICO|nr:VOC family protein [Cryobacterium psychrophilum]TDW29436.1 putative glyoxalase superfamily metalloenzyme YdcJ [Cryobacterium psychrophilum]TFD81423.1 VOC family protein [Cryobacterium psychrophilum]